MEEDKFRGITCQLLHISAQLEVLTEYVMKDTTQSERDKIKKLASERAEAKLRLLDAVDSMIIPE